MDNRKHKNAILERREIHEVSPIITLGLCLRTISWLTWGAGDQAKHSRSADLRRQRSEFEVVEGIEIWMARSWRVENCQDVGEIDSEFQIYVSHKSFAQGWAVHLQSNTQGLSDDCFYQVESQTQIVKSSQVGYSGPIRWERPWWNLDIQYWHC